MFSGAPSHMDSVTLSSDQSEMGNLMIAEPLEHGERSVEIAGNDLSDDQGINPDEMEELAASFVTEFKEASRLSSLETALPFLRKSLDLHPADHPLHSRSLDDLALAWLVRFHWTGEIPDLDEAIHLMRSKVMGVALTQQSSYAQPETEIGEEGELQTGVIGRVMPSLETRMKHPQ